MNSFKKITILSLIFSSIPLLGHIYKVDKFVKGDLSIICFSDEHNSRNIENQINAQQRKDIIEIAKALDANMVLEDKSKESYNTNSLSTYLNSIFLNNKSSPLLGLTILADRAGLTCDGIDFRKKSLLDTSDDIALSASIREEINEYNDNPVVLNPFYKDIINEYDWAFDTAPKFFNGLKTSRKNFNDINPSELTDENIKKVLTHILANNSNEITEFSKLLQKMKNASIQKLLFSLYDSRFIDALILHKIFALEDFSKYMGSIKNICICAGGNHIKEISPLLERMGWKKIVEIGQPCSILDYEEPKAINLGEIKNILLEGACLNKSLIKSKNKRIQVQSVEQENQLTDKRLKISHSQDNDIDMPQSSEEQQVKQLTLKQQLIENNKEILLII